MMAERWQYLRRPLLCFVVLIAVHAQAQTEDHEPPLDVHVRVQLPKAAQHAHAPPVVVWLKPLPGTPSSPFLPEGRYTLTQKDRMFIPHLLVVPVGSEVFFPNRDPFFHNVFSLFDGKRFDLGLYEAGTTKKVNFSREGVSYIFCNIHPEMSAVVVSLSTPLYTTSGLNDVFTIKNVPVGAYEMHVWIEGVSQPDLERLKRPVQVSAGSGDLGVIDATASPQQSGKHLNKFGQPYDRDSKPTY